MRLSIEDRLKFLVPSILYYPHKINSEILTEPELALLVQLVNAGSTAIDVGANRGIYSYALAKVAAHVEAFEPNPALARFARTKLGRRARVHQFALSNMDGAGSLHIPFGRHSQPNHLVAGLRSRTDPGIKIEVPIRTLDSFGFKNVSFIKIDVEGSELEVLEGARDTILRDRPNLLVELLAGTHDDPFASIAWIESTFGYRSSIVIGSERCVVSHALDQRKDEVKTRNILFSPA
jgi:FkbM family methyltransferase